MINYAEKDRKFLKGLIKSKIYLEKKKLLISKHFKLKENSNEGDFSSFAKKLGSRFGINILRLLNDPLMEDVEEEYENAENPLEIYNLSQLPQELFDGFRVGEQTIKPSRLLGLANKRYNFEARKSAYLVVGTQDDSDIELNLQPNEKIRVLVKIQKAKHGSACVWGIRLAGGSSLFRMCENFELLKFGADPVVDGEEKKEDIKARDCVALKIGNRMITLYRLLFRWLKDSPRDTGNGDKYFTIQLGASDGEIQYNQPIAGPYILISGKEDWFGIWKKGPIKIEAVPPENLSSLLALKLRGDRRLFTQITKENAKKNMVEFSSGYRFYDLGNRYSYAFKKMDGIDSILNDPERNITLAKRKEMILAPEVMSPNDIQSFYKKEQLLNMALASMRIIIALPIIEAIQQYAINFDEILRLVKGKKPVNPEIKIMILNRIIEIFRDVIPKCELETGDDKKVLIEDENYFIDYAKTSQFMIRLGYFVNGGVIIKEVSFHYTGRELKSNQSMPALKPHRFHFKTNYGPEDNPNARFVLGKNIFGEAAPVGRHE